MIARFALLSVAFVVCGACKRTERSVAESPVLRVCADPNNLPFTNDKLEGFENRIAELVAKDIGARVSYSWFPQRRGFIRNTLRAGTCDVVMGIPSSFELAWATAPYYRSTYVFLSRADRKLNLVSFDDDALRKLKIGVHLIGDDYANAPPGHALAKRGIIGNVSGFTVYGDYSRPNPPARIVEAVTRGDIDVAIVWGPLAGYFAKLTSTPLDIVPVSPEIDTPFMPFVYDISMGVRRDDPELHARLQAVIRSRRDEIDAILAEYGVPRVDRGFGRETAS